MAFLVGSLLMFTPPWADLPMTAVPAARLNPWLIGATTLGVGAFFLLGVAAAFRAQLSPLAMGRELVIGKAGLARQALDPYGIVHIEGEEWTAEAPEGEVIPAGARIRVVALDGLRLRVLALTEHQHLVVVLGEARGGLLDAPHEGAGGVDEVDRTLACGLVDGRTGAVGADEGGRAARHLLDGLHDAHPAGAEVLHVNYSPAEERYAMGIYYANFQPRIAKDHGLFKKGDMIVSVGSLETKTSYDLTMMSQLLAIDPHHCVSMQDVFRADVQYHLVSADTQ